MMNEKRIVKAVDRKRGFASCRVKLSLRLLKCQEADGDEEFYIDRKGWLEITFNLYLLEVSKD